MKHDELLEYIRTELETELMQHILPYWSTKAVDTKNGGFIGRISGSEFVDYEAPKSCILNARILWFFSSTYRVTENPVALEMANRSFEYLETHFLDKENGGFYWSVDAKGNPLDRKKHVYAQSFAIYGLSEFVRATGNKHALDLVNTSFKKLDLAAFHASTESYIEGLSEQWIELEDVRLSETDLNAKRSFNSHLHLLEALTTLFRVSPSALVKKRLEQLIDLHLFKIFDPKLEHFLGFFDENWTPINPRYSYGHDIEASWLLCEAASVIGDEKRVKQTDELALKVVEKTFDEGFDTEFGGLFNAGENGKWVDSEKQWWAPPEAIVGLMNMYSKSPNEKYVHKVIELIDYIKSVLIDAQNGEWFFRVNRKGEPFMNEDKVGAWKCPYHTGRACLEIMERVSVSVPVSVK